jgi:hypothetical protein
MSAFLTLTVNLGSCPGVTSTALEHRPDGTVCVTVHGGNPKVVGAMILQCLPPGTATDGDTLVKIGENVVRLTHVDPTPEQPEDFVAPLPLVTPEGRHEPMGVKIPVEAEGPRFQSKFAVLVVVGALLAGGTLLWVLLNT